MNEFPTTHKLKCNPVYFQLVKDGHKKFELRRNDRNFGFGDLIDLHEYDPSAEQKYSGRVQRVEITFVLSQYPGLEPGYCILSIEHLDSERCN